MSAEYNKHSTEMRPTAKKARKNTPPIKQKGAYTHKFDLAEVEKICQLHPTDEELAAHFGCDKATIERRKLADPAFLKAYHDGRGKRRLSLRRQQLIKAEQGDTTMLIWLGKQLLGQRDVARQELTGADAGPVETITKVVVEYVDSEGPTSETA